MFGSRPFVQYFLFYCLNISVFYFHSNFLINHLSNRRSINLWLVPAFVIAEFFTYYIISAIFSAFIDRYIALKINPPTIFSLKYGIGNLYRGILFTIFGTGYYFFLYYLQKQKKELTQFIERERLKNELLRAEQDFLRAQINPHLLFNTLSFIKYAAKRNPMEADEAVTRLSGIMGFALDNNNQTILLTKELEQVENIIGLNQLRFNHSLKIDYFTHIENKQAFIIPIILLTLVENVFKHGNLMDEKHPAAIHVTSTKEYILLETANLPNRNQSIISTHKGLSNITSRLYQNYKDHHIFKHGMDGNLFKVYIKINLHIY